MEYFAFVVSFLWELVMMVRTGLDSAEGSRVEAHKLAYLDALYLFTRQSIGVSHKLGLKFTVERIWSPNSRCCGSVCYLFSNVFSVLRMVLYQAFLPS